jgi:hypothetical protein
MRLVLPALCLATICAYSSPLIEGKVGYFFFTDSTMRKVYDQGGVDAQLSGAYPMTNMLHIYGSIEYAQKSGHSLNGHQKTSIWFLPLSLGIQPQFEVASGIKYYFTLGPRYIFAFADNDSSYVSRHMNANGIAGFANTGFLFIMNHFTVDLFGEYSYSKLQFHSSKKHSHGKSAQVGGLAFGAGLGYTF